MTRQDHLLIILAEECNEVGQRATKALRFGTHETQPVENGGEPGCGTNAERIMHEYADLYGIMEMLVDGGVLAFPPDWRDRVDGKKVQVEKYLGYSYSKGRLE